MMNDGRMIEIIPTAIGLYAPVFEAKWIGGKTLKYIGSYEYLDDLNSWECLRLYALADDPPPIVGQT